MKTSLRTNIVGYGIAIPLIALVFMWYNHIYFVKQIPYWKWLIMVIPILYITYKHVWMQRIIAFIFGSALVLQVASWLNIIQLSIF